VPASLRALPVTFAMCPVCHYAKAVLAYKEVSKQYYFLSLLSARVGRALEAAGLKDHLTRLTSRLFLVGRRRIDRSRSPRLDP
jgi:hypothetical protein